MFFVTPLLKNGIIKSTIIELSLFDWVWKQSSIDYHFVVAVHPLYIKTFGTLFVFVLPDVILRLSITMTSWWARWRLKSPASRLFTRPFIRAQIKVNVKAPRHWPLCVGNSPVPVNSPHKWPVTRKMLPFDDVIINHTNILHGLYPLSGWKSWMLQWLYRSEIWRASRQPKYGHINCIYPVHDALW